MKRTLSVLMACLVGVAVSAAELGDDGLHKTPWMRDTFKDLREDLEEASDEGKRLVLFIEQQGCIYCKKMHEEVFPQPDLAAYIEENFFVVQLDLHGSTTATDFDGEESEQRALMRKWGILFTPTLVFLPEEVPEDATAIDAAVAVMPGAFSKGTTMDLFTWVFEKRYELENGEDFQRYHARRIQERNNVSQD
ncbi:thioredoxin fold domain-containing protein [Ruegeria atlantica]|uniref:Thioredoxin fold domain-containing protein n=1 Tax=Ruegeria atlantica TaxID=81569 RepID=A0AA90YTJ8_9RHOB|nr:MULTISPECIES: thioredoxin family protein [Ruegeria]NOC84265.1 thioredoxin fold domain-containing protein [Ruegeria sp. HKCCD6428]NOE18863.1 thioredoxin fold domain-containing protein [Ruegeria atlantica]